MGRCYQIFSRRKRMMEDLDQDIHEFIERETQDNIELGSADLLPKVYGFSFPRADDPRT